LLRNVKRLSLAGGGLLLSLGILTGCGRDKIEVYRLAKEQPQAQTQAQPAGMPAGHPDVAGAAIPGIKYTLPAGWKESDRGQMRAASFSIEKDGKQVDVSVVPLSGFAGDDLANVNRWRSMVGLPAVTEEELPRLFEKVQIAGEPGQLYDLAGENPGSGEKVRIIVAFLRHEGVSWFFKMNGDDALVEQQKPAFAGFLKSVNFQAPPVQPAMAQGSPMSGQLPPSHPPIDGALPPSHPAIDGSMTGLQGGTPAANPDKPTWEVPANWKEIAAGQFLIAKFVIADAETTQVNVSLSGGTGGGLVENVNRWRGQLGLSPLSDSDITKLATTLDTPGGKATVVDFSGTDARSGQKARLIGAILPQGNRTWFYKLMGDEQVVGRERQAFSKFVQTAKYPHAA